LTEEQNKEEIYNFNQNKEQQETIDELKNELRELNDKYYNLKKDSDENIENLNIKLSNYSNDIDNETKSLTEEENKEEIDNFNQNKALLETIEELKNELKDLNDKYYNFKKDNDETIKKLNIKLNN
jgi:DnaJ-domain-containing protein 1